MTRKRGFTLVELMIVMCILGLLAVIAIPNYVRGRNTAQKQACVNNLRQIDGGKQQWAIENKKPDTATPTADDVFLYIKAERWPNCPADGTYTVGEVNTDPTCTWSAEGHKLSTP
jgi:prepilin-type N-terminal cleavage/methylation domain-containing protein